VITFEASIPTIQRGLQISGGDGARVIFDIPESSLAQALYLVQVRGQPLKVSVEATQRSAHHEVVPDVPKRPGDRQSMSQKLRSELWCEFLALGGEGEENFREHYRQRMEKIISMVNSGEL